MLPRTILQRASIQDQSTMQLQARAAIIYNYKHFQFTFWNIGGHLEYDAAWITKVSKICETIEISVI